MEVVVKAGEAAAPGSVCANQGVTCERGDLNPHALSGTGS